MQCMSVVCGVRERYAYYQYYFHMRIVAYERCPDDDDNDDRSAIRMYGPMPQEFMKLETPKATIFRANCEQLD